jgi:hypothetical protein
MKYPTLIFTILFSITVFSQNCTEASLLQKPGTWKESSGGGSGITAADLAREKKIVASIHTMIKSKYSPMGVNIGFNGGYGRPESNMPSTFIAMAMCLKQPKRLQLPFLLPQIHLMPKFTTRHRETDYWAKDSTLFMICRFKKMVTGILMK